MIDQGLQLKVTKKCILAQFRVRSVYLDRVNAGQSGDLQLQKIRFEVPQGQSQDFVIDSKGTLHLGTRLCVPGVHKLRKEIFVQVFYLSTCGIGALETLWITAAVTYSRVEVGHDCHGFCKWFASYF